MSLARNLERRLELLVDGIAGRLFRGRIHPVELGDRLVREADLALFEGPAGPTAPNDFLVVLGGEPADDAARDAVEGELAGVLQEAAIERGWRLEGPAAVRIQVSPGHPSALEVTARVLPGQMAPWARLLTHESPGLDICPNRALVGRGDDCDVHLPEPEVSRHHALIWRERGVAWVADLDSSNGTALNGEPVSEPAELGEGDLITFGDPTFVFRLT